MFFKHFHQFWHLSDKMSLIKWISRCLFTENVSCCDWLTQNLLSYLTSRGRDFFSLFSTRASALWCCRLARLASSLVWLVGNYKLKFFSSNGVNKTEMPLVTYIWSNHLSTDWNFRAMLLMQYLVPLGKGPSLNTWPRWESHWNVKQEDSVVIHLRNKTCFPCLHRLVKNEANVWENSRADQWKPETQSRVFTNSRFSQTLPRFSPGYEGTENIIYLFYKIIIFRLNKEKGDIQRVCML